MTSSTCCGGSRRSSTPRWATPSSASWPRPTGTTRSSAWCTSASSSPASRCCLPCSEAPPTAGRCGPRPSTRSSWTSARPWWCTATWRTALRCPTTPSCRPSTASSCRCCGHRLGGLSPPFQTVRSPTMPLRFGLLGTGYWARETHAAALAIQDGAELVGVWGRNPTKAAAVAERYGVRSFGDPDALFAAVDAVAFALPPDVQAELAVRAATAGRHLLLEKPLALALPVLGPVERVTAATGLGDTVHLVLEHRGGASTTLSLSLTAPPAAEGTDFAFYGPRGVSLVPPRSEGHASELQSRGHL